MAKKAKKAAKSKSKPAKAKVKAKAKRAKNTARKAKARAEAELEFTPENSTMLPVDLDRRLSDLAQKMDKTFEAVVLQALCEFADAWEDHFRTVAAMVEDDERVQIVVKPE